MREMAIAAILFDLDDTLVVDGAAVDAALLATCAHAQAVYGLDPQSLAQAVREQARALWRAAPTLAYCRAIGISSAEGLWARFAGNYDPQLQALRAWAPLYRRTAWAAALAAFGVWDSRLAERLAVSFPIQRRARHWAFPEVKTTLGALQGGYRLALVTNGAPDLQREKLTGAGLAPYFTTVVVSGEIGVGKPDPRIFIRALADVAVDAADAVFVGDHRVRDIGGAQQAGLRGIWINRQGGDDDGGTAVTPDGEIARLSDLQHILENREGDA